MDEQEKIFSTVDWVFLLIIAGISDGANAAAILIFPFPGVGQVVLIGKEYLVSPITWAIIQGWFIMKTHGARTPIGTFTKLLPVFGGFGNFATIPGSEIITTAFAMWMADHPKAAGLTVVAGAAIATGGAGAAAAGATEGAVGATATGAAATSAEVGAAAETGFGAAAGKGVATDAKEAGELGEAGAEATKKEISPEALGGEKPPLEKLQEELTQKIPANQNREAQEEAPEASNENQRNNNVIDLSQKKKQSQGPGQNVQLNGNEINLAA